MRKLVLILFAISTLACSKKDEPIQSDIIDTSMEFSIFNSDNEDMLDTVTVNHIDESEIKLFYEVNGEINTVYYVGSDYPKGFKIYRHENEYRIKISMNSDESSEKTITYIQWSENDSDTLEAIFERPGNSILKRYVWLNDLEVWNWTLNDDGYYKIIKEN